MIGKSAKFEIVHGKNRAPLEKITPEMLPKMAKGLPTSFDIELSAFGVGKVTLARVHYTPERMITTNKDGVMRPHTTNTVIPARIDVTSDFPQITALLNIARAGE